MSTITVHRAPRTAERAAACATRLERLLLRTAAGLSRFVEHRMDRRAPRVAPPVREHDEGRADAAATLHMGILPR